MQVTVSCQDTFEIGKTLDETRDLNHFKSSFKTLVKKKSLIRKWSLFLSYRMEAFLGISLV